jgi:beta-phosphoglucomutase-like phosphatase (HAD superfamily)
MNLAIFDIDGTLTESVAVDELCFVKAFRVPSKKSKVASTKSNQNFCRVTFNF